MPFASAILAPKFPSWRRPLFASALSGDRPAFAAHREARHALPQMQFMIFGDKKRADVSGLQLGESFIRIDNGAAVRRE